MQIGSEVVAVAWSSENQRKEEPNASSSDEREGIGLKYASLITADGKLEHFHLAREESELANQKDDLILRTSMAPIPEEIRCDHFCERNQANEKADMTIQERYKLPEMPLTDKKAVGERRTTQSTKTEYKSVRYQELVSSIVSDEVM